MAVIRVAKTENFTVMSNHHLRNRNLSLKAKGLMSLMLSLPPEWDYSVGGLAAICKEGATAVRSALKELEENCYLIRERKNSEKGYFIYEYTLYEIPDLSHAENTHTVDAHTEERRTENRTQINKDSLNTKKIKTDKIIKDKKDNSLSTFENILNEIENKELKQLYIDYIDMRNTINSPVSARALSMLVDRCARMANFDIELQKEMIEAAVINNWKSVYLPKDEKPQNKNEGNSRILDRESRYSKGGYDALRNFNLNS